MHGVADIERSSQLVHSDIAGKRKIAEDVGKRSMLMRGGPVSNEIKE